MTLDVGDKAPDFSAPTDGGGTASLKALKGKNVILYFYAKDDTPGCTTEACGFRDAVVDFSKVGAEIIGASKDSVARHDKFKAKHNIGVQLAADTEKAAAQAYGVWVSKSMYGHKYMGVERSTFLVDAKGKIFRIWRKVKVPGHVEEVYVTIQSII